MQEDDGSEVRISPRIQEAINKRPSIEQLIGVMCNDDNRWTTFANKSQRKRLMEVLNKAYGWEKVLKNKSKKGQDGDLIPPH